MLEKVYSFIRGNIIFLVILAVSAFLRFIFINQNPPSLNWDEVSHGYNAYSIITTGRDEWGVMLPNIFRAYGDYKLPVYIYSTALSVLLFGLNEFAVRLPSAISGVITVIFSYFLVYELFKDKAYNVNNKLLASVASLLVAVEPWSLFLSRGAFEANLALTFIIGGVYFFILLGRRSKYLVLSSILFGLSVWTYNSARIFVPLILAILIYFYKKELVDCYKKNKATFLLSFIITLTFFVPMFLQLASPVGRARYGKVALINEGAVAEINELRRTSSFSPMVSRLFYNKGTFFIQRFVVNYFSHFSPLFLFIEGGSHYQFSIPNHGLVYFVNFVFLVIGLVSILKKRIRSSRLVVCWLLLSPIPSSLTSEAPHVLRSIIMLPVPMILSSLGFVKMVSWVKSRLKGYSHVSQVTKGVIVVYVFILFVSLSQYLNLYFKDYRNEYSWSWQYGHKQLVAYVRERYCDYEKIIVTKKFGEPHEFFLFYCPWDPQKYLSDSNLNRFYQSNWYWVDRFDKFYFVNDWDIPREEWDYFELESGEKFRCEDKRCLLVGSVESFPKGWRKLKTIQFLNGDPAFVVFDNQQDE